jgi:hypothetical protein
VVRLSHLFEDEDLIQDVSALKGEGEPFPHWHTVGVYYAGGSGVFILYKIDDTTPGIKRDEWRLVWATASTGIGNRMVLPDRQTIADTSAYAFDWNHKPSMAEIKYAISINLPPAINRPNA